MSALVVGFTWGAWFTNEIAGGIVSGVLAAGLVLLTQQIDHWRKYRKPWQTKWEPRRGERCSRIDLEHQDTPTRIQLVLLITARVHVTHILFDMAGGANVPKILRLYDWNRENGEPGFNVILDSNDRGAQYWHYINPFLRTPGKKGLQNTISVGLEVQTKGAFAGNLLVQLAYEERVSMPKKQEMPFLVTTAR